MGGGLDLPDFLPGSARRRLAIEPGQEAGQRQAVAPVRRARAVEFDCILARLG